MRSYSNIPLDEFELDGKLILSSCPGLPHGAGEARNPEQIAKADISQMQKLGVKAVLSLVEEDEFIHIGVPDLPKMIRAAGIAHHWFPIVDRQIAKPEDMPTLRALLSTLTAHLSRNEAVLIHCYAGLGRSGTIAALIMREKGATPSGAREHVRAHRQGAIESQSQLDFIENWVPES